MPARKKAKATGRKTVRKTTTKAVSSDKTIFLLSVALVIAIGAYLFLSSKASAPKAPVIQKTATVVLDTQNKSGESGTVTLKEMNGKVQVSLNLVGAPKGVVQPAHIHVGACPTPGDVKYPLTSVVDGKSETTLDVSLGDLLKQLPLAVNVHKSVAQSKVYVACGNVTAPGY